MGRPPRISIIIPAYFSQHTLDDCLVAMKAQSYPDYEVILIDSSPTDDCERIVLNKHDWVRYEHVEQRMLPHEARNYGARQSTADILIFTDPDVYPEPEWLSILLEAYQTRAHVIVGSVLYYGKKWRDIGSHLAKFDLFLPGGVIRPIDIAPTLNMLCPRPIFNALGGFSGEYMIGDTIFSWELVENGYQISFVPQALVRHHHTTTWRDLLHERFVRGREFGNVRAHRYSWDRHRILLQILVTIVPLRWSNLMLRTLRSSLSAGMIMQFLMTSPMIISGHAAWLLGEIRGLCDALGR